MKLKKWKVTYTSWRETWSGYDQNDGDREEIVKAKTARGAIAKVKKENFGGSYSHCIWGTNWHAEELKKYNEKRNPCKSTC